MAQKPIRTDIVSIKKEYILNNYKSVEELKDLTDEKIEEALSSFKEDEFDSFNEEYFPEMNDKDVVEWYETKQLHDKLEMYKVTPPGETEEDEIVMDYLNSKFGEGFEEEFEPESFNILFNNYKNDEYDTVKEWYTKKTEELERARLEKENEERLEQELRERQIAEAQRDEIEREEELAFIEQSEGTGEPEQEESDPEAIETEKIDPKKQAELLELKKAYIRATYKTVPELAEYTDEEIEKVFSDFTGDEFDVFNETYFPELDDKAAVTWDNDRKRREKLEMYRNTAPNDTEEDGLVQEYIKARFGEEFVNELPAENYNFMFNSFKFEEHDLVDKWVNEQLQEIEALENAERLRQQEEEAKRLEEEQKQLAERERLQKEEARRQKELEEEAKKRAEEEKRRIEEQREKERLQKEAEDREYDERSRRMEEEYNKSRKQTVGKEVPLSELLGDEEEINNDDIIKEINEELKTEEEYGDDFENADYEPEKIDDNTIKEINEELKTEEEYGDDFVQDIDESEIENYDILQEMKDEEEKERISAEKKDLEEEIPEIIEIEDEPEEEIPEIIETDNEPENNEIDNEEAPEEEEEYDYALTREEIEQFELEMLQEEIEEQERQRLLSEKAELEQKRDELRAKIESLEKKDSKLTNENKNLNKEEKVKEEKTEEIIVEEKQVEEKAPEYKEEPIREEKHPDLHIYGTVLNEMRDKMKSTLSFFSSDSPEFKNLYNTLKSVQDFATLSEQQMTDVMQTLTTQTNAYIDHTRDIPKSGERRSTRVDVAHILEGVTSAFERKVENPRISIAKAATNQMVNQAVKNRNNGNGPDMAAKQEAASRLQKMDSYKDLMRNSSVYDFYKLATNQKMADTALKNIIAQETRTEVKDATEKTEEILFKPMSM